MAFHMRERMLVPMVWLEPNEWKKEKQGEVKLNTHTHHTSHQMFQLDFFSFLRRDNKLHWIYRNRLREMLAIVLGTFVSLQPNERKHLFFGFFFSRLACAAQNENNNKQQKKIHTNFSIKINIISCYAFNKTRNKTENDFFFFLLVLNKMRIDAREAKKS